MQAEALLNAMTPEVYDKLRQAVETGKWLDGSPLSDEQRETCMQAVMLYQARIMNSDQHMTVGANGEIVHKSRQELKQQFSAQPETQPEADPHSIARFKQDDF